MYKFDGSKKIKLPSGNRQVSGFKKFIIGTLDGSLFSNKNFHSSFIRDGKEVKVEMIPQNKILKRRFEKIAMRFDFEHMILLELVFFESDGDNRMITFTNHKINTLKDSSIFK